MDSLVTAFEKLHISPTDSLDIENEPQHDVQQSRPRGRADGRGRRRRRRRRRKKAKLLDRRANNIRRASHLHESVRKRLYIHPINVRKRTI